jgi:hypothetical protein
VFKGDVGIPRQCLKEMSEFLDIYPEKSRNSKPNILKNLEIPNQIS